MLNDTIIITKSELNSKIDDEIEGITEMHNKDVSSINEKIVSFQYTIKSIELFSSSLSICCH